MLINYQSNPGTKPELSVIFPHKDSPQNNELLEINVQMLKDNTIGSYELIVQECDTPSLVYPVWNELAEIAQADTLVFSNSDIFMAPEWDVYINKYKDQNCYCGIYLVECGAIGVHSNNIPGNFGYTGPSFKRTDFEKWVENFRQTVPECQEGFCWIAPSAINKRDFLQEGGWPIQEGVFPLDAIDMLLMDRMQAKGYRFVKTRSFAYHLQFNRENCNGLTRVENSVSFDRV